MKQLAILGSTGSIGIQTLEVVKALPDVLKVEVLAAGRNWNLLAQQAKIFEPNAVIIDDPAAYPKLKEALAALPIKVYCGSEAINDCIAMPSVDLVVAAMVGFAGLESTLKAIQHKKNIALANKETLVVAGDLITQTAYQQGVSIFPVDSEHSAIFQCLAGEWEHPIEEIILTASGGPFRGFSHDQMRSEEHTSELQSH